MAVQIQLTPDFDKIVSEDDEADGRDVCIVNMTNAVLTAPPVQDEDKSYCTRFLSCLTRCLVSKPKPRGLQLPTDSTKRKSLTMKWELEVLPPGPPEQVVLQQELDDANSEESAVAVALESVQGPSFQLVDKKPLEDPIICINVVGMEGAVTEVVKNRSEKRGEDINAMDVLKEKSVQYIPEDEDHHTKSSLEEWEEIVQLPTREYFDIEAAVIADRTGGPRSKGLTLHISMDTDKKMYDRPRENVIYENGLIRVQTGRPLTISENTCVPIEERDLKLGTLK